MLQFKKKHKRAPIVLFLDIKAAYDSTDPNILLTRIRERDANGHLLRIIEQLMCGVESVVAVNGVDSAPLKHRAGVLQGSIISPVLYSLYIDSLPAAVREILPGQQSVFLYADDVAVVIESEKQLKPLMEKLEEHSYQHNYRFNPRKCEIMNSPQNVSIYGEQVPHCETFGRVRVRQPRSRTRRLKMLPPATYPSIHSEDDEKSVASDKIKVKKKKEDKVKAKLLRSFIVGYKNADKSCRYCPDHPKAAAKWNSTKGYHYLVCSVAGCREKSIFQILGNFNLEKIPDYCHADLAYVAAKTPQASRAAKCPKAYSLPRLSVSAVKALSIINQEGHASEKMQLMAVEAGTACGILNAKRLTAENQRRVAEESMMLAKQSAMEVEEAASLISASPLFHSDPSEPEGEMNMANDDDHYTKLAGLPMSEVLKQAAQRVSASEMSEEGVYSSDDDDEFVRMVAEEEEDARMKGRLIKSIEKAAAKGADEWQSKQTGVGSDEELLGLLESEKGDYVVPSLFAKASPVRIKTKTLDTGNRYSTLPVDPVKEMKEEPVEKKVCVLGESMKSDKSPAASSVKSSDGTPATSAGPKKVPSGYFPVPDILGDKTRSPSCPVMLQSKGTILIEFNESTKTFTMVTATSEPVKASFVGTAAQHIRAEKAKVIHMDKLKNDTEYAKQYVATGFKPKPVREKTELSTVWFPLMKPIPRNELRTVMRTVGVDCSKVIDIGFYDRKSTFLIVRKDYEYELIKKMGALTREVSLYWPFGGEVTDDNIRQFADKLEWTAGEAMKNGRLGLRNYQLEYAINVLACLMDEVPVGGFVLNSRCEALKRDFGRPNIRKIADFVISYRGKPRDSSVGLKVAEKIGASVSLMEEDRAFKDYVDLTVQGESVKSGHPGQSDVSTY